MQTMTEQYPALRHLFGAYLNQSMPELYGTLDAALDGYRAETGGELRSAAIRELQTLLATGDENAIARTLDELGNDYVVETGGGATFRFLDEVRRRIA